MSQYPLLLSLPPVYSADNFFVSDCNREAWQWINIWPNWPAHALILYGPQGSGKSHLAAIWAQEANAIAFTTANLTSNLLIENIEQLTDERALFHLFNSTKENKQSLLLTSAVAPAQLPFTLPDLRSRLLSLPAAAIHQPDDEAIAGVLRKQFTDRQMKVEEGVITYILPRIERSLGKVKELVERIDNAALAEKKSITVPFVKKVMGV